MSKYTKWVSFWGNAMGITENSPARYGKNITLRYPLYGPFAGEALKLTFDNFCGTEEIVLTKVRVGYKGVHYSVFHEYRPTVPYWMSITISVDVCRQEM